MTELDFADPDGLAAVLVLHDLAVDRHIGGVSVVVEHIPLHTTGNPRTEHTYISRLHHFIMIEDIISVCLVDSIEQTTADLRKHAKLHILILEEESLVCTHLLLTFHILVDNIHIVIENIRIYTSACTLV